MEFGYYPHPLDYTAGDITISTLPDLDQKTASVLNSGQVEGDWCYAPNAQRQDIFSGRISDLPYPSRVFSLPKTHAIMHRHSTDPEHLSFLVWVLGFIYRMRFSETEAGFLDATPIRTHKLHDMSWGRGDEEKAIVLADQHWYRYASDPRIAKALAGIIHSFFLSNTQSALCFERFVYVYMAFDGCHFVWSLMHNRDPRTGGHASRIARLCADFNRSVPDWADPSNASIAGYRNQTLHEGLFFGEPLGFRTFRHGTPPDNDHRNYQLEMEALVCRFLCAILGFHGDEYIQSPIDTRQLMGIEIK